MQLAFTRKAYKFVVREFVPAGDLNGLREVLATTRHLRSLEPLLMDAPKGRRVLLIAPHEDDEMIGPGGTVLKLIHRETTVRVVYLTKDSGVRGETRRRETKAVSARVGYQTEFLDYPANALPVNARSAKRLARSIDSFMPDALLLPFMSDDHPDHRAASLLLHESHRLGQVTARPEVWAYQVYSAVLPNVIVDITDIVSKKAEAIRLWRNSAMRSRDWAHYALGLNAYNSRLLKGATEPRYVEAFFVVPFREYMALCKKYRSDLG